MSAAVHIGEELASIVHDEAWTGLEWLVAVGRNKKGEIFFYDTGGDIIEDLGALEYLKQRLSRAHMGEEWD